MLCCLRMAKPELPILYFKTPQQWAEWLAKNFEREEGVWLRYFKKGSGEPTITYAEALDEALCYGWVDSQAKGYDDKSYLQKYTPRRAKSIWSKRNIAHIARLEKDGRMQLSGWQVVEAAKADGRWQSAYDSPSNMVMDAEFLKELAKNKAAQKFYDTLNKTNTYSIAWRLQTAKKPETRAKRITEIIAVLAAGKTFH